MANQTTNDKQRKARFLFLFNYSFLSY